MPSFFGDSSPELENLKKPKTTLTLKSLLAQVYLKYRTLLFVAILLQVFVVVLITLAPNIVSLSFRQDFLDPQPGECESGRVYVYDLPAMFNKDLLNDCKNIDPWLSKCDAVSNDGYGRRATELAGLVPENLAPTMYWTDLYMGEIIYHNRILNYKCRTLDPESATAFYIPFYAGIAVCKYLWNHTARERDQHCEMVLRWVQDQPYWKRSNGSDHIIMLGRDTWAFRRFSDSDSEWGSSFIYMPAMKNIIRISPERRLLDDLDVAVPYPTSFHPRSKSDVREWQDFVRRRNRPSMFCFVGAPRDGIKKDFRALLTNSCGSEPDSCRFVDCGRTRCMEGTTAILEAFLESDFCLQPRGDCFTRRSVFDCMVAGSIPVFFWKQTAYEQYETEWFLPGEPESYSVFIDQEDVRNGTSVKRVLERYSREDVGKMREKVIQYMPRFLYAKPGEGEGLKSTRDAFDIAVDGVMRKFKDHMRVKEKSRKVEE